MRVARCRVFNVSRVRFRPPQGGRSRSFYCIEAPDWVNVIPLLDGGRVLLLRQYRFGLENFSLEIPGGVCETREPPKTTAARELREETGYRAKEIVELGWVHPNPALQANRCHCYLARGLVRAGPPRPDRDEQFEAVEVRLADIPHLIRERRITHTLVVSAFQLLAGRKGVKS